MSRCRKDDTRFQLRSSGGSGSPSRHYGSPPPVAGGPPHTLTTSGGHNYIRSKGKDRVKNSSAVEISDHNFAQEKQVNIKSAALNNGNRPVAAARELSWGDEVDLTLPNSGPQRTNTDNSGVAKEISVNAMGQNAVDIRTTGTSSDLSQKMMAETDKKMMKDFNANPPTEYINGKAKQHGEKDHDLASYKRANCPQPRRGSRKKTLSLNPEEREALENLIEEVLMDGAIDSDSASSDDDAEQPESWKNADVEGQGVGISSAGTNKEEGDQKMKSDKGKMGRKYYPGQLKVALKHMTELPPRFSRKLKKAEKYLELNTMRNSITTPGRIEEEDEESLAAAREEKRLSVSPRPPEREKEKAKLKEHHAKEFKRSIRTLLRDHNQYVEDSGSQNSSSVHPPGAIICEDLERETLNMQGAQDAETHEVPSSVQNLMLAAKALSSMDANLPPEEIFTENEVVGKNFTGNSDLVPQRYVSPYAVMGTNGGGQYVMNVPEFVPAGMVSAYSPPEISRPEQQQYVHQYGTALLVDQSLGVAAGKDGELGLKHGLSSEQMSVIGQISPNIIPNSSVPNELFPPRMMEFSASVPPPPLAASMAGPLNEKLASPMASPYVSSEAQLSMSSMLTPGSLPFYQFQNQNMPLPPASYGYPIQAPPYSASQYCYMPPALPPQTIPQAYYPRDQSPYQMDPVHFKSAVNSDWGYQKSKQYSNTIPTIPNYSTFSNLNIAPIQYPSNDPVSPGMNQLNSNFRQRKKQSGSNISPRTLGNSSSVGSGKLANQRARQNESSSAALRGGHRLGQDVVPPVLQAENGLPGSAFGDSNLKRLQLNARSRTFFDGSSSYPGRRENRNFASEKYASQRTFGTDGKKEGRHVILKPKQTKPNRNSARSRNDTNIVQMHPVKPYHQSDLSEEGLESPDNFGDVESGADDWSTDNYEQEVSVRAKPEDSADTSADLSVSNVEEVAVTLDTTLETSDEIYVPPVEEIPVTDISETVTGIKDLEYVFSCPEKQLAGSFDDIDAANSVDEESRFFSLGQSSNTAVDEDLTVFNGIDRSGLVVENVKKFAIVPPKFKFSVSSDGEILDQANSISSQPAGNNSACISVDGSIQANEHFVNVDNEVPSIFPETSSIDMELSEEKTDVDLTPDGMKLVLGSKFIYQLRRMFEGDLGAEASESCLPMTVYLSHHLLTQLHREILLQVSSTTNDENATSGCKSLGRDEAQKMMDTPDDHQSIDAVPLAKESVDSSAANQSDDVDSSHHKSNVGDDSAAGRLLLACDDVIESVTVSDEL